MCDRYDRSYILFLYYTDLSKMAESMLDLVCIYIDKVFWKLVI